MDQASKSTKEPGARRDEMPVGDARRGGLASRRGFVAAMTAGGAGALLVGKTAEAVTVGPMNPTQRRDRAFQIRVDQATANRNATNTSVQATNGDEERHANKIGNFSKGLPHDANTGEVSINAYNTLDFALRTGTPSAFESITLGGARKLVNPQAGLVFQMEGADGPSFKIPPPPEFRSREAAAEISENYWMALLRDVPFAQYPTNAIATAAAADLTRFGADAKVPKSSSGQVTPALLFRGLTPGDRIGPYLAQFFYLPSPFGGNAIEQRIRHPQANTNFMTDWTTFVAIQNGATATGLVLENTLRYMRSGRGIGEWVRLDVVFQGFLMAFLTLSALGAPLDPANPYTGSRTQAGFATFGAAHISAVLCEVALNCLQATWYQKWFAHRRLRNEAYAGAVHARLFRGLPFDRAPVHQEILDSITSSARLGGFLPPGNALLSQAYPDGSPLHPAYTAGHATIGGACATILKAFFNESFVIPNPLQPSDDGLALQPFTGASLTVGGELNKLASNLGNARNITGIHWRSDTTESLKLGEALAIQLMQEDRPTFNEMFSGHSLTKFDGTTITI
jgi:hypothetical protein